MTPRRFVLMPSPGVGDAPAGVDDTALLTACAGGDTNALGVLFDRRAADVRRFIFRLAGTDARDLDDLVQATFLEALRAAARFRGGSSVKTWLFGIAANVVRHHARSEGRKRTFLVALSAHDAQQSAAPAGAELLARRRQQLAQLEAAVAELPHDLRVAFVMCDVELVPGVEAARCLGVPEGTVWRRLHDARKRLRKQLGDEP